MTRGTQRAKPTRQFKMTRFLLSILSISILAGCAVLKPEGCSKSRSTDNCVYTGQARYPVSQKECEGRIFKETPRYPAEAQAKKISGQVTGKFDVNDSGNAKNITLEGDKLFFATAAQAISRSCWKAGSSNQTVSYSFNPL